MKKRTFKLYGYEIDVFDFGYKQYMYPSFNGDAEFEVTHKGFRKLSTYLKNCLWIREMNKMFWESSAEV